MRMMPSLPIWQVYNHHQETYATYLLLRVNLVRRVMATETASAPSTVNIGDTAYDLDKGETIKFQGNTYSAHVTSIH
jgi:hypothetical protein